MGKAMRPRVVLYLLTLSLCSIAPSFNDSYAQTKADPITLYYQGEIDQAISVLKEQIQNSPGDSFDTVNARLVLIDIYRAIGDVQGISEQFDAVYPVVEAAEDYYSMALLYGAVADAQIQSGLYAEAEDLLTGSLGLWYMQSMDLEPEFRRQLLLLGQTYRFQKRFREADIVVHRAIVSAWASDVLAGFEANYLLTELARHYFETRRFEKSRQIADTLLNSQPEKVWARTPDHVKLLILSGGLDLYVGDVAASEPKLEAARALVDDGVRVPYVYNALLQAFSLMASAERGDTEQAAYFLGSLRKIAELDTTAYFSNLTGLLAAQTSRRAGDWAGVQQAIDGMSGLDRHPELAHYFDLFESGLAFHAGDTETSVEIASRGLSALLQNLLQMDLALYDETVGLAFYEREFLGHFIKVGAVGGQQGLLSKDGADSLLMAMQLANQDPVSASIAANQSRQEIASQILGEEVRSREILVRLRSEQIDAAIDDLLANVSANTPYRMAEDTDFLITYDHVETERRIDEIDEIVSSVLPDYAETTRLHLASLKDIQSALRDDEAIVIHAMLTGWGTALACLTRDTASFAYVDVERADVIAANQAIRSNINATLTGASARLEQYPFEEAAFLYQTLFEPVADCYADKSSVLIAANATVLSVPTAALVTRAVTDQEISSTNASIPWFIERTAISIVPSLRSFVFLRTTVPSRDANGFLGIGDPNFSGVVTANVDDLAGGLVVTRGANAGIDHASLAELPETQDELREMASIFEPAGSTLLLGDEAHELNLRRQALDTYDVIAFATHALVGRQDGEIAEPGLVLSPTLRQESFDDGYLSMTEIAELSLNASLVILSACDTAAGDGTPDAQGLTGLANAFFFAGSRSLLVTQWPVETDAAKLITTRAIAEVRSPAGKDYSHALRNAMLVLASGREGQEYRHPAFWAPFMYVGAEVMDQTQPSQPQAMNIVWQSVDDRPGISELLHVVPFGDASGFLASGFSTADSSDPERAASSVTLYTADGHQVWRMTDEINSANGITALAGGGVAVAGDHWDDTTYSSPSLRNFSADGSLAWEVDSTTATFDNTIEVIELDDGRLVSVFGQTLAPDDDMETAPGFGFNVHDAHGNELARHVFADVQYDSSWFVRDAVMLDDGTVAVIGSSREYVSDTAGAFDSRYHFIDYCMGQTYSDIHVIDIERRTIVGSNRAYNVDLRKLAFDPAIGLVAIGADLDTCGLEGIVGIYRVRDDLSLDQSGSIGGTNAMRPRDFVLLDDRTVLVVGSLDIKVRARQDGDAKEPVDPFIDDAFWNTRENTTNAFFLVTGMDGEIVSDHVFPDAQLSTLNAIAEISDTELALAGARNGDNAWLMVVSRPVLADRSVEPWQEDGNALGKRD